MPKPHWRSLVARSPLMACAALAAAFVINAQAQLIYTETFNTDGDGTRYTSRGKGLVLLIIEGNPEPSYWTHSSEVTKAGEIVGLVIPAAGRRAAITFQSAITEAQLTPDALKLIDNTIKWLTADKPKLKVLFSPPAVGEGDLFLAARLTAAGHTVVDDDPAVGAPDAATIGLVICTSGALPLPTRFTRYAAPLLTFNAPNHDDELISSIGVANGVLDPGEITVTDTTHPIAAGLPKTFTYVTEAVGLDTVGTTIPEGGKIIASYKFMNVDTGLEETRPLLMVIEKGVGLLGGAFKGFEGTGFWAGADMNEPTVTPDCCATVDDPRQLTLNKVNVTGKKDVRITVALAATDIDFETTDFLRIMIDPDGDGPAEFTQLVRFSPPTGNDKFFSDNDNKNKLSVTFRDVTYKVPDGATDLVVRFESTSTFFNEIVAIDNVRIHAGDLAPAGPVGQPLELGKTVKGFQDDFTAATRNADWKVRGPGGDLYKQEDGMLRVTTRLSDPNHLLYEAAGYNPTVQEVLARIRITAFGTGDYPRAGLGVAVQTAPAAEISKGINLHFRDVTEAGTTGKHFLLLDDARAWGTTPIKEVWAVNDWYWMRLRHDPNANGATDDVFAKVWKADGKVEEPADWQVKWNYIPSRTSRTGFAGLTGSSSDASSGLGSFEVDYILIKADGLPEITPKWALTGPGPTTPKFTAVRSLTATQIELEWVGAGNLESANDPAGPWTVVAAAGSPRKITTTNPAAKFYRLKQ